MTPKLKSTTIHKKTNAYVDYLRTDTCAVGFWHFATPEKCADILGATGAGLSVGIGHCNVAHFSAGCIWHSAGLQKRSFGFLRRQQTSLSIAAAE